MLNWGHRRRSNRGPTGDLPEPAYGSAVSAAPPTACPSAQRKGQRKGQHLLPATFNVARTVRLQQRPGR